MVLWPKLLLIILIESYHGKSTLVHVYTNSEMSWSAQTDHVIKKTYLYNFDPHKPYFYIVKLGLRGVYIIFLISAENQIVVTRRGGSNE